MPSSCAPSLPTSHNPTLPLPVHPSSSSPPPHHAISHGTNCFLPPFQESAEWLQCASPTQTPAADNQRPGCTLPRRERGGPREEEKATVPSPTTITGVCTALTLSSRCRRVSTQVSAPSNHQREATQAGMQRNHSRPHSPLFNLICRKMHRLAHHAELHSKPVKSPLPCRRACRPRPYTPDPRPQTLDL